MDRLLDTVLEAGIAAAPHALKNFRSRHHLSRPAGEHLKHPQRPPLELQCTLAEPGLPTGDIDTQAASHHNPIRGPSISQRSANPSQQHLAVSTFHDVVGRPMLDTDHLVAGSVPNPGKDDDGKIDSIALGPQLIEHLGRIHVRHLVIEQHQIRRADSDSRQGLDAADSNLHQVAGTSQQLGRDLSRARLVVHDKQLRLHAAIPAGNLAGSAFVEETLRRR